MENHTGYLKTFVTANGEELTVMKTIVQRISDSVENLYWVNCLFWKWMNRFISLYRTMLYLKQYQAWIAYQRWIIFHFFIINSLAISQCFASVAVILFEWWIGGYRKSFYFTWNQALEEIWMTWWCNKLYAMPFPLINNVSLTCTRF